MPRLTKTTVDGLRPLDRDRFEWDSSLPGFGVRVMPSGAKTYQVQYRMGGRTRRMSLGRHGVVTVEEARRRAREVLGEVARGDNPAERAAKRRSEPTVRELSERFVREHMCMLKPRTREGYRAIIEHHVLTALGSFKITDVSRADIAKLHHAMRDKPYQANRTLGVISIMFNKAEVWGLRPDGSNPCRHVKKYPEIKRETFLSPAELARLSDVLAEIEAEGAESHFVVAAFRLLILTGCRRNEVQTLRWEYVTGTHIELPDTKTGARRIPLTAPVRAVLEALPRDPANPYVIRGKVPGGHVTDLERPWRRIRARAGLDHVRIHDLRHTYASHLVARGETIQMVGKLLGHSQIQTTMRYAHLADDAVVAAAETAAVTSVNVVETPG
jgi:integrase